MLAKNILRINGYDDKDTRTHIDIEVKMRKVAGLAGEVMAPAIPHPDDVCKLGFERGLTAITSYNYWNFVAGKRLTDRIW